MKIIDYRQSIFLICFAVMICFSFNLTAFSKGHSQLSNSIYNSDTIRLKDDRDFTIERPRIPEDRFITVDEILTGVNNRKVFYKNENEYFSHHLYTKVLMEMYRIPKSILGFDTDSSYKGVFYLSESISEIFYKDISKSLEIVKATRISGDDRGIGRNYKLNEPVNIYSNLIYFEGVTNRGIVSPLSRSASFYYNFEIEESFLSSGHLIHSIKLIPKRSFDPVFTGYIFIVDSSWDVYGAQLMLNTNNGINYFDSIYINLQFKKTANEYWMPEQQFLDFQASHLGYKMSAYLKNYYSDYVFHENLPDSLFINEKVRVLPEAILQFYDYWDENRPESLSIKEIESYQYQDSIYFLRRNIKFNDSIDAILNKMEWYHPVFSGYTYWQSNKNLKFYFRPLIQSMNYNYVEGLTLEAVVNVSQPLKNEGLIINGLLRYSSGREDFSTLWEISQDNWKAEAGRIVVDFNQFNPYDPYLNSIYTLFTGSGHMKMFEKSYFSLFRSFDIRSNFLLDATLEFAQRDRLENSTSFTFSNLNSEQITPNNPADFLEIEENEEKYYIMERHESMIFEANLTYSPGRVYARYPDKSLVTIRHNLPILSLNYRKGIPWIMNSILNYDLIAFSIYDQNKLGLMGTINWKIKAGSFVNKKQILFPDFYHFNTNRTVFMGNKLDRFQLLNNYKYSTRHRYLLLHAEHSFGGFVFNKIPLLKHTQMQLITGLNALHLPHEKQSYLEPFISVDNILGLFRINYVQGFLNDRSYAHGISVGMKWPYLK